MEIILVSCTLLPSDSIAEFVLLISLLIRGNLGKTLLPWTLIVIRVNEYMYHLIIWMPHTSGQEDGEETWVLSRTCFIVDPEYYECCST